MLVPRHRTRGLALEVEIRLVAHVDGYTQNGAAREGEAIRCVRRRSRSNRKRDDTCGCCERACLYSDTL
jgi:hypothetical protein